jgi:enamine deaminase RidA (YjgF/YER057c/UK114 family)
MMRKAISAETAPTALGPYSQAIVAGGFVRGLLISIAAVAVLPSA